MSLQKQLCLVSISNNLEEETFWKRNSIAIILFSFPEYRGVNVSTSYDKLLLVQKVNWDFHFHYIINQSVIVETILESFSSQYATETNVKAYMKHDSREHNNF